MKLLQGTLDLLILRTLQTGAMHGWAISDRIQQISEDVLRVNQGSPYPALHRLEHRGWIKAEWGISEMGRRARFYRLTASGKKQLERETDDRARLTAAIGRVLESSRQACCPRCAPRGPTRCRSCAPSEPVAGMPE